MVILAEVVPKAGESIDSVLRRFKRKTENAGVLADLKKHEHYVKPSVKAKLKSAEARKRDRKRQQLADKFYKSNANFKFSKDKTTKIYQQDQPKYTNNNRSYNQNNGNDNRPYQKRDQRPYNNQQRTQQQGNYQNRGQQLRQDTKPQQGYSNNPKRR